MGANPSVPTDFSRKLEVIGAGYSRTGTLSMALALEKLLDGPVMHGGSQFLGREDAYVKLWTEILDARNDRPRLVKLLRKATAGFVAITDAPGNCFIEELLEIYPDAEVVSVQRDRERWWKSWEAVVKQATPWALKVFLAPVPGKRWYPKLVAQYVEQQEEQFGGPMTINRMDEHNDYVKRVTPPSKYHMISLTDGWVPLCKILGKPIPAEHFPRANDAEAVDAVAGQILREALLVWGGILGALSVIVYVVWSYLYA